MKMTQQQQQQQQQTQQQQQQAIQQKRQKLRRQNVQTSSDVCEAGVEEFSANTNRIDNSIYSHCKRSKLKIIFMHNEDLIRKRNKYFKAY